VDLSKGLEKHPAARARDVEEIERMSRNPDRYFSIYARGRKKQAPGLIRTARQSRVAKMIRKARGTASKHRYDWIPEEGIAPGQNPRRRRRRNEQLGILWKQYEYHGSTIQETGRGRWKVYTPGGSVSPTLTSKRAAERWARVYGTKIENRGGRMATRRRRRNLFGFGKKSKAWRIRKRSYGYDVMHGSKVVDVVKTKREADDWVRYAREKDRERAKRMKSNPKKKPRKTTRAKRRNSTRRRNRKITFPVPVTPAQKKKLARWLRTNFGKRVRVK